jgi:hypothetical protein
MGSLEKSRTGDVRSKQTSRVTQDYSVLKENGLIDHPLNILERKLRTLAFRSLPCFLGSDQVQ